MDVHILKGVFPVIEVRIYKTVYKSENLKVSIKT